MPSGEHRLCMVHVVHGGSRVYYKAEPVSILDECLMLADHVLPGSTIGAQCPDSGHLWEFTVTREYATCT